MVESCTGCEHKLFSRLQVHLIPGFTRSRESENRGRSLKTLRVRSRGSRSTLSVILSSMRFPVGYCLSTFINRARSRRRGTTGGAADFFCLGDINTARIVSWAQVCNRYVKLESDFLLFDPYLRIDTWRMPFSARRSVFVRYSDRLQRQRESQDIANSLPPVCIGFAGRGLPADSLRTALSSRCSSLFSLQCSSDKLTISRSKEVRQFVRRSM